MMANAPRMDAFTRQYFETALWSSSDNSDDSGGEQLDKNYDVGDIADETRWQMIADCADFQTRFGHLYDDSEQAGHDFWLSRNGHGTGFFDRDTEHADELQAAAESYGEFNLYVGDDGEIHGTPIGAPGRDYQKVRSSGRHVADFNSLDDLIEHAGASHLDTDEHRVANKLYVPEGRGHRELRVWQKEGYWHAQSPENGKLVNRLPSSATPIINRSPRKKWFGVRDYEAVDNRDRHIAGPFKSYSDARAAAGSAGVVKFVPKGKSTVNAPRHYSDISAAIDSWNRGDAYRDGSLQTLIETGLVAKGKGGWAPTASGYRRGLGMDHLGHVGPREATEVRSPSRSAHTLTPVRRRARRR